MVKLTKEEYKFCVDNIKTIEQIVVTSACSSITNDYRTKLYEIGKKYGIMDCGTCNSTIYLGTCRLYDIYLANKQEKNKNKTKTKGEKENGNNKNET